MIASFVARTTAVSMTVYITKRFGVWDQAEESERLFRQVRLNLKPLGGLVRDLLHLPEPENELSMGQLAREVYNQGIKDGFNILQNLPDYSEQLASAAKMACLDMAKMAKELSCSLDVGMPSKKVATSVEKSRSTVVIVSPGVPLKVLGNVNDDSNISTGATVSTGSTDLALKQALMAGWTPSLFQPTSKSGKM
ncbi:MICOS complex subunit MIC13 homolog QIL1 [Drosophila kikkawai]|uniref:MICOS complex subunit MIC13 n=1 Tax=Drosophila kikkawai TaxID=30033 RepID=A0ABM3C553_DROKI|nr:uncharacterized protein LOC121502117 [Drosophila kikkawai]